MVKPKDQETTEKLVRVPRGALPYHMGHIRKNQDQSERAQRKKMTDGYIVFFYRISLGIPPESTCEKFFPGYGGDGISRRWDLVRRLEATGHPVLIRDDGSSLERVL